LRDTLDGLRDASMKKRWRMRNDPAGGTLFRCRYEMETYQRRQQRPRQRKLPGLFAVVPDGCDQIPGLRTTIPIVYV